MIKHKPTHTSFTQTYNSFDSSAYAETTLPRAVLKAKV
jgi:hypothetical protein